MTKRKGPRPDSTSAPATVLDAAARCKNTGGRVAPNGDCLRCGAVNAEKCR